MPIPITVIGRLLTTPILLFAVSYFAWKTYQRRSQGDQSMRVSVIIVCLFLMMADITATPPYSTWGLRATFEFAILQALVFAYFSFDQLLNSKGYRPVWRSRLCWGAVLASGLLAFINYFQQDNLGSFGDGEFFRPTLLFYTSYMLNYAVMSYVLICILRLYVENLRQYIEFTYFIRRLICMVGILILAICCSVLMETNLALSIFYGDTYRATLNQIYYAGWALSLLTLCFGLITPQAVFQRLFGPLERFSAERQRESWLSYLHERMMSITPHVQLQNEQLRPYRRLIEIGDARQVMWSHIPHHKDQVQPREEAECIFDLLRSQTVLVEPAALPTPAPSQANIVKYYVAIAKHLRKLEAGQATRQPRTVLPPPSRKVL